MAPARGPKKVRKVASKRRAESILLEVEVRFPPEAEKPSKPAKAVLDKVQERFEQCLLDTQVMRKPFTMNRQWIEPRSVDRRRKTPPKR